LPPLTSNIIYGIFLARKQLALNAAVHYSLFTVHSSLLTHTTTTHIHTHHPANYNAGYTKNAST